MRIEHGSGNPQYARLREVLGEGLAPRNIAQLGVRCHRWPHRVLAKSFEALRAVVNLGIGVSLTLYLYALAALRLAVLLQQFAPPMHTLAHRVNLIFGNHPINDAETLGSQRLHIPLNLCIATFGNAGADGVRDAQPLI